MLNSGVIYIKNNLARIKENPDYWGSVLTGYMLMGLNIVIQIILVPLYLKTLGKYEFGVLMVLLSLCNYVDIGIGWLSGGMLRILGEYAANLNQDGFKKSYTLSKLVYLGYGLIITVGIIIIGITDSTYLFKDVPFEKHNILLGAVIATAVYILVKYDFSVERQALAAMKKQFAANVFQIVSVIGYVITVIPWLITGGGLHGVMICFVFGMILARIMSYLYWRRLGIKFSFEKPDKESWDILKRLLGRMGLGFLFYGMILLTLQADVLIVGWIGGVKAAAEFVFVWKIAEVIIQIIWRIPEYLQPYLIHMDTQGDKEQINNTFKKFNVILTLGSAFAGAFYALTGPYLIKLWVGSDQVPTNHIGFFLAGGAIFWLGSARLFAIYAYSTTKLNQLNIVASTELILKLIVISFLFPKFGYISSLIAINVVHLFGVAIFYRKLVRLN